MAFILKPFKTVRNNWKKSVFFAGALYYGVDYAKRQYDDSLLRAAYCKEAQQYGDKILRTNDKLKKITVFLNPAAKNGKGRKIFEKNVAPILHLAGFEVRVVKTEYEGQAKDYMSVLEDEGVDAIVVAGGNGTLSEVVTGLFRRPDADKYRQIPIGFIPMGATNSAAETLFHKGQSDPHWQMEAALSVIKGFTQQQDLIKCVAEDDRHIYFFDKFEKGLITDVKFRKKKNWYFGVLKHRWAYFRESVLRIRRTYPHVIEGELQYKALCEGCSKCFVPPPEIPWKWWHIFLPPQRAKVKDLSGIINESCGDVKVEPVITTQLDMKLVRDANNDRAIEVSIGPKSISRFEFVRRGWAIENKTAEDMAERKVRAGEVSFVPKVKEGVEEMYTIDNETKYEVMPVRLTLQRDIVKMYCSQPEKLFIELPKKESTKWSLGSFKLFDKPEKL